MNIWKVIIMAVIAVSSLSLIVPLFTDDAGLLPSWMLTSPYPLVFLILWCIIFIGAFTQMIR